MGKLRKERPERRTFNGKRFQIVGCYKEAGEARKTQRRLLAQNRLARVVPSTAPLLKLEQLQKASGQPIGKPRPGETYYILYARRQESENWR
jgi:hypothetical protein